MKDAFASNYTTIEIVLFSINRSNPIAKGDLFCKYNETIRTNHPLFKVINNALIDYSNNKFKWLIQGTKIYTRIKLHVTNISTTNNIILMFK